jgi:formylglycine-generating enzyme required for sulfatase activity
MRFRLVPAGLTHIGSPPNEHKRNLTDLDRRREVIAQPFWLAETPTTQREYFAVTGQRPSYFAEDFRARNEDDSVLGDCPVESVSWENAVQFCMLLSQLTEEQQAASESLLR